MLVSGVLETSCIVVTLTSVTGIVRPSFWGESGPSGRGQKIKERKADGCQTMDVTRGTELFFEGIEELIRILDLRNNLRSRGQYELENGQVGAGEVSY